METYVDKWWCCLNSAERGAMVLCAGNAGPVTYFVVKALFDAYWAIQTGGSITIRKEIFIEEKYMTLGEFPPEAPDAIEVYFLAPEYWDEINAFIDEHGAGCDAPCKILAFSS